MPDSIEKSQRELCVFREFAERSGLPIVSDSIEKRDPDEPDILCRITGQEGYVAFELKEWCAEEIAQTISKVRKNPENPVVTWSSSPTPDFLRRTKRKEYKTGYPIELVFYTDARTVETVDMIVPQIRRHFAAGDHTFRRVWLMGASNESCECICDCD